MITPEAAELCNPKFSPLCKILILKSFSSCSLKCPFWVFIRPLRSLMPTTQTLTPTPAALNY